MVIRLIRWFWQRLPFTAGGVGGQPSSLTEFLDISPYLGVSVGGEYRLEYHGFRKATAATVNILNQWFSPRRGTLFLNIEARKINSNRGTG